MPFSSLPRSAPGTYPFSHEKTSTLIRQKNQCRRAFQSGRNPTADLAATGARFNNLNEKSFRLTLTEAALNSHGDGTTVNQHPNAHRLRIENYS